MVKKIYLPLIFLFFGLPSMAHPMLTNTEVEAEFFFDLCYTNEHDCETFLFGYMLATEDVLGSLLSADAWQRKEYCKTNKENSLCKSNNLTVTTKAVMTAHAGCLFTEEAIEAESDPYGRIKTSMIDSMKSHPEKKKWPFSRLYREVIKENFSCPVSRKQKTY